MTKQLRFVPGRWRRVGAFGRGRGENRSPNRTQCFYLSAGEASLAEVSLDASSLIERFALGLARPNLFEYPSFAHDPKHVRRCHVT